LRALRWARGLSLEEAAELAGRYSSVGAYNASHLSHVETGRARASEDLLTHLTLALGTALDELEAASRDQVIAWIDEGLRRRQTRGGRRLRSRPANSVDSGQAVSKPVLTPEKGLTPNEYRPANQGVGIADLARDADSRGSDRSISTSRRLAGNDGSASPAAGNEVRSDGGRESWALQDEQEKKRQLEELMALLDEKWGDPLLSAERLGTIAAFIRAGLQDL